MFSVSIVINLQQHLNILPRHHKLAHVRTGGAVVCIVAAFLVEDGSVLSIEVLDARNLAAQLIERSLGCLVEYQLLAMLLIESLAVSTRPICGIDILGSGVVEYMFLECGDLGESRLGRLDRRGELIVTCGRIVGPLHERIVILDAVLLQIEQHLRHLLEVESFGPADVTGALALMNPLLDVDQHAEFSAALAVLASGYGGADGLVLPALIKTGPQAILVIPLTQ